VISIMWAELGAMMHALLHRWTHTQMHWRAKIGLINPAFLKLEVELSNKMSDKEIV
jgi:hypothetical protein